MRTETSVTVYRKDYLPYPFDIPEVSLVFDLDPEATTVRSRLAVRRRTPGDGAPLELDGSDLELISVSVDGRELDKEAYRLNESTLALSTLGDAATVEIVSRCRPAANSTLMGLYVSGGNFFTQCEAEGFRRITWFADRPDVMSRYRVTLRATSEYPVLLSNGNLIESRTLPDGRAEVVWEDPFPKPCYLFALVAGRLTHRETRVTTASGREVLLQVYSDPGSESKTGWALESLVRALRWDESRFGLELDLDRFMVVAVRDFNMGAMENKGLNIFNAAYVLANADTATDANYEAIESVIGHEYFHNWTGNRVTCRDWFQLSLKEGLTVFRDQEFSADMMASGLDTAAAASARAVKRIDDVVTLRAAQFPEDGGPMAHPIRPESYQEIGNFYTATVYEKGAEVIRMQHTLLGDAGFRAGMDEYFRRHDGQAVTCDDFVAAMESVYTRQHPGRDLGIFRRWYSQAGTPRVAVELHYDAPARRCTIRLAQRCAPVGVEKNSPNAAAKKPFHIPFAVGLMDRDGRALMLNQDGRQTETAVLELTTEQQEWVFEDIPSAPVPSLLRGFSAPVIVEYPWSDEELALLSAHDTDPFARWEAGQELATREILALVSLHQTGAALRVRPGFIAAWRALLEDAALDEAYRARALALPSEKTLAERMSAIDPPALAVARDFLRAELGRDLAPAWRQVFEECQTPGPYRPAPEPAGKRALKNMALTHLLAGGDAQASEWALAQYKQATNMTDRLGAMAALVNHGDPDIATGVLGEFYEQWQQDPLVIDKWFSLQATARSTTVQTVRGLMAHPAFTLRNPNRARALVFQFCLNNARGLHVPDGSGYDYWVEQVLALDALNPEVAARLARAMDNWSRFVPVLRAPMRAALERVRNHPGLSRNVSEIVSKALELAA
ncbi:aminopeptidase N [Bordetella flabilis]|uniref:Aminopeptidase N n=1 Tax=Bordetella flabilis TaxID=463014 RepID=A0A193GCF0_9BORD|nr:aminopeptidase N [Bordetella flabilis]ANN77293.1 aminopeptidase N [Bordetella flabilis]